MLKKIIYSTACLGLITLVSQPVGAQVTGGNAGSTGLMGQSQKGYFQGTSAQQQTSKVTETPNASLLQNQNITSVRVEGNTQPTAVIIDEPNDNNVYMYFMILFGLIAFLSLLTLVLARRTAISTPDKKDVSKPLDKPDTISTPTDIEVEIEEEKILSQLPKRKPKKHKKKKKKNKR